MWTIRREQMRVFERNSDRRFRQRVKSYLRERLNERGFTFTDEAIEEHVDLGFARAASLGIQSEADVARFLELAATLMGGFGAGPFPSEANRILETRSVPAAERLERFACWALAYRNDLEYAKERNDAVFE